MARGRALQEILRKGKSILEGAMKNKIDLGPYKPNTNREKKIIRKKLK